MLSNRLYILKKSNWATKVIASLRCLMPLFFILTSVSAGAYSEHKADQIIGSHECIECHDTNALDLNQTPHALLELDDANQRLLQKENMGKIATAMGVNPKTAIAEPLCASCHATLQVKKGKPEALEGPSCESCHGAAKKWFDDHPKLFRKKKFSELKEMGMVLSHDVYGFTQNCLGCHMIPNEQLVSAGHFAGKPFVLPKRQSKVKHGKKPSDITAAKMVVLGYSIELEKAADAITQTEQSDGKLRNALKERIKVATGNLHALETLTEEPLVHQIIDATSRVAAYLDNYDANGFKALNKTLTPLNRALSDAHQPNILDLLKHQHIENPTLITVQEDKEPIDPVDTDESEVIQDPVSESNVTSLPEGSEAVSRFQLITPASHTLCSASNPWLLGKVTHPNTITLSSGHCHGMELELAHNTHLFLFHVTSEGKITELLSERCDLLKVGSASPAVGVTHFMPKDAEGKEGVLILDDQKGEEWLYLFAVNSPAGIDTLRAALGTPPNRCIDPYSTHSGGYDAVEAMMRTLDEHRDVQMIERAITHE